MTLAELRRHIARAALGALARLAALDGAYRASRHLEAADDRMLADIGLTREDAAGILDAHARRLAGEAPHRALGAASQFDASSVRNRAR